MKTLTLPNKLTISRIIAVPVFLISFISGKSRLAVLIFAFCVVTDFLDGLIARQRGERTALGAFLDPLADKFLLISAFVAFAGMKKIELWIPIVVVTKNIIIFLGWWLRFHITGNSVVSPTLFGKAATVLEMTVIFFILLGAPEKITAAFTYLMLFSIIVSTFDYIFSGVREMEKK